MTTAEKSAGRRLDRVIVALEAFVGVAVVVAIVGKTYGVASTITFVLSGAAIAFTGFVLVRMLSALSDETLDLPGPIIDSRRQALEDEKLLLLQGIKEFEADAAQGKVDAADYDHLRKSAEARALQIIHEIREMDARFFERAKKLASDRTKISLDLKKSAEKTSKPEAAPKKKSKAAKDAAQSAAYDQRPVMFLKSADGATLSCEGCQTQNDDDARFCIGCGRPRAADKA